MSTASPRYSIRLPVGALLGLTCFAWAWAPAAVASDWQQKAKKAEEQGRWGEACRYYDEWSRKDRSSTAARQGYLIALRRFHLANRHAEALYRQSLAKLTTPQALDVYDQVLGVLTIAYPDRTRTTLPQLFSQGLQEVRWAVDDPTFRKHYLPTVQPRALASLKSRLANWEARALLSRTDTRAEALALLRALPRDVGALRGPALSAIVLELAAGACASLDEHSLFLTPGRLARLQAAARGDAVGVGIDVGLVKEKMQVTRVYTKGPASGRLREKDQILAIAGKSVKDLDPESVAELLRGKQGEKVKVQIDRAGSREEVTLTRGPATVTSVDWSQGGMARPDLVLKDGRTLGYLKVHHFQGTTAQEVKTALAKMTTESPDPIKGLVLDLRGNPGGLFRAALSVAELFLSDAVIVVGQSPLPEYNKSFKSESTTAMALPVVVLIDADTASSAEVLAGALKEARRTTTQVMGQTSYGKGSIQCLIPLEKTALGAPAGLRLTVAKLLSPTSQGYTGRGVTPDVPSKREGEELVEEAVKKLGDMLSPPLGMGMMGMNGES